MKTYKFYVLEKCKNGHYINYGPVETLQRANDFINGAMFTEGGHDLRNVDLDRFVVAVEWDDIFLESCNRTIDEYLIPECIPDHKFYVMSTNKDRCDILSVPLETLSEAYNFKNGIYCTAIKTEHDTHTIVVTWDGDFEVILM